MANSNIDGLFIYYKYNNLMVSNDGMNSAEDYYNLYMKNSGLSYDEWISQLNESRQNDFIPYKIKNSMGQVKNVIAYTRSLPLEKYTESDATLMILLDLDTIYSWLDKMDWINNGHIYVIDRNNTIIISNQDEAGSIPIKYDDFDKTTGTLRTHIDGDEVVVSYAYSKITDWKYVVIIPTKIYLEKARFVRNAMFYSILICLLGGGILSWLFTHRNYKPIMKIANMIGITSDNIARDRFISYNDIESSIHSMIEKDQLFQNRLDAQNKVLRKHFITRLVTGRVSDHTYIQSTFESYNVKLETDLFAVLLFYIEDFTVFYDGNQDYSDDETIELVHFIITNVVEELMNSGNNQGFMVDVENTLVCLINFGNSSPDKEWLMANAREAQSFINEKFGIVVSISISSVIEGIENIYSGYQEAMEAMEYKKFIIGELPNIIEYDSIHIETPSKNLLMGGEEKFINCIKLGNYEEARNILNAIIDHDFNKPSASVKLMKYRMFGLINTLLIASKEISIMCEDEFSERIRPIERLLECDDVKQLKHVANDILESVHSYVNDKKAVEKQKDMKAAIIQFIQANYADMNLNVSSIAQHFDVSVSYISKYFKKQCGINLLDYIHTVRIEKAKLLMQEENYTVEEIAQMVGYYSSVSFIRSFKKHEKITPGRYMGL